MIYTITLNPAVDKTIMLNNFHIDQVNRVEKVIEDAGGKGINVSKMIKNLNGKSIALGIVGGMQGAFIKKQLSQNGINHDFIEVDHNTRVNLKIVDMVLQTFTDINERGCGISEGSLKSLEDKIFTYIKQDDILVLSGSVPKGCSKTIYREWIERANKLQAKTIIDADGELLKNGVIGKPFLVKPNIFELERLFNTKITSVEEMIYYGKQLIQDGISIVVISRGEKGSVFITQEQVWNVKGLKVDVKSTVGAGDAMVGGLAYALDKGESLEEMIKWAVSSSTSSILKEGTSMGELEEIIGIKNKIVPTQI